MAVTCILVVADLFPAWRANQLDIENSDYLLREMTHTIHRREVFCVVIASSSRRRFSSHLALGALALGWVRIYWLSGLLAGFKEFGLQEHVNTFGAALADYSVAQRALSDTGSITPGEDLVPPPAVTQDDEDDPLFPVP